MWKRIPQPEAKTGRGMREEAWHELFRQNNVMHLTFKQAYNAVESKQNSCTMPNPDTCN